MSKSLGQNKERTYVSNKMKVREKTWGKKIFCGHDIEGCFVGRQMLEANQTITELLRMEQPKPAGNRRSLVKRSVSRS